VNYAVEDMRVVDFVIAGSLNEIFPRHRYRRQVTP